MNIEDVIGIHLGKGEGRPLKDVISCQDVISCCEVIMPEFCDKSV